MFNLATLSDVQQFLHHVIFDLDVNFHPDTDFRDYVTSLGSRSFPDEVAEPLNEALVKAFAVCEANRADIYEMTLSMLQERILR